VRDRASLTAADFEASVGTVAQLVAGEAATLEVRLSEVVVLAERAGHRRPFSLRFRGPPSPVLEQAVRRIEHPEIGELELFLVPIASDSDGATYEAVFA
jgi:hypothetical protein